MSGKRKRKIEAEEPDSDGESSVEMEQTSKRGGGQEKGGQNEESGQEKGG